MAKITGYANLSNVSLYTSETNPSCAIGTRVGGDGAEFKYVKVGITALVVGNLVQSSAYTTNWNALTLAAAAAIGATTIKVTNSANAVTADQFKFGTLSIDAGTGVGQIFTILSNTADLTGGTITFVVMEPVRVALAVADSKVTLRKNPCDGVIALPITTMTGSYVGVAIYPIPASSYGWIQTKGIATCISDNTSIIMGSAVEVSLSVAAAVALAGTVNTPRVGVATQAASNGHYIQVDLGA